MDAILTDAMVRALTSLEGWALLLGVAASAVGVWLWRRWRAPR